jgi:DNA mismatch endonuclease (patch repair protein)
MARIKSANTGPELNLRSILRSPRFGGLRLRFNCHNLPGKPDVYIRQWKLALFIDGCFFHLCPRHGHFPKTNCDYWSKKLSGNKRRDVRNTRDLRRLGIGVLRIWEHDLPKLTPEELNLRIDRVLDRGLPASNRLTSNRPAKLKTNGLVSRAGNKRLKKIRPIS